MSRLPLINRDALAPDDQAVWDRIAAVRTGVRGPFGALMHVPTLADRVAALEDYFRFNAALPAVEFRNFEFTQKEIRVKAGEQVALRVVNVDAMPHSFDIDELDVHAPIPANGSGLALFRAGKPGRYLVYCAPHFDKKSGQGMKATLIVE